MKIITIIFRPSNGGKQCVGPNTITLECTENCIEAAESKLQF